jgi:Tfp pilus assembly protein PilF
MNRPLAWTTLPASLIARWGCWLVVCCGCAQWPGATQGPDLSQAGGSRLEMAQMSERLGRPDLAEKFYRDVLAQQPNQVLAHHRLGALAARDGRWKEANEHFRLARRSGPPSAELLTDVAYAQYERRQVRAAERTLRQALEIDPQHAKSRSLLALVLNEQGRFREGLAEFRRAVRGIEGQGGSSEHYGVAAAAPAAPPSGERTEQRLAAAGVRGRSTPEESSNDSLLAESSPRPVERAPSVGDRVVGGLFSTRAPHALTPAAPPVRLPPPPEALPEQEAEEFFLATRGGIDRNVIVRIDPPAVGTGPPPTVPRMAEVGPEAGPPALIAASGSTPPAAQAFLPDRPVKQGEHAAAAAPSPPPADRGVLSRSRRPAGRPSAPVGPTASGDRRQSPSLGASSAALTTKLASFEAPSGPPVGVPKAKPPRDRRAKTSHPQSASPAGRRPVPASTSASRAEKVTAKPSAPARLPPLGLETPPLRAKPRSAGWE